MATDPQSLLADAACFQCFTANGYGAELIELALLKQILLASNPMADTTPQTLLDQAKCFACYATSPYMLKLMELSLLVQIADGGGAGGGGGGTTCTAGVPVAAPASGCGSNINTLTGDLYLYYGGAWHLSVSGSGSQMVLYTTTDPTTDGVTPANINADAIAYRADGTQPIFVWDPAGHAWH